MMGNDQNAAIGAHRGVGDKRKSIWWRLLLRGLFAVALVAAGVVHAGDQAAGGMETIEGSIWYRERIALPPGAEIHVYLEDVARMDVPAELVATTSIEPRGGPPWSFALPYDREKLHDRGRYVLRVRIEDDGRLLFINTESTPAFARDASGPLEIRVSRVTGSRPGADARVPDVSLTDTYWKLVELDGQAAALGAGERELHMVFSSEENRVRGFSGCNRFTGSYKQDNGRLRFAQLASTRMACMEAMEPEQRFLVALRGANRFSIQGDELALYGGDERLVLRFKAVALQ
jgi:putative lipoprotein